MEVERPSPDAPFFSICIPQYNRTSFIVESCRSLMRQTFKRFEVCISDDCSTDGRQEEWMEFLKESRLPFVYRRQATNQRYDANLRASIHLARGEYCFLLGNDDAMASATTLEEIYADLQRYGAVGVAITNYKSVVSGRVFRRMAKTGLVGCGPYVAAAQFRNLSFLSGILLDRTRAQALATDQWDGSEMYQVFVACRMVAENGKLLGIHRVAVHQGIQVPGEQVDSYASRPRLKPCPIVERKLPLALLGPLVVDAIAPSVRASERPRVALRVLLQILLLTYPYWIIQYRQVQSWPYALGVCLGMRPRYVAAGVPLSGWQRVFLSTVYGIVSFLGMITPGWVFQILERSLYRVAKSIR